MIAQESINAAIKLIALYRSITIEQIEKVEEELGNICENYYGGMLAGEITGFSMPSECLLCKAVNEDCNKCIYNVLLGCISDENMETYQAIKMAKSPEALVYAFNKRADHIQSIVDNLEKGEKQLAAITKLCDELNLDFEEVIENIDDEKDDFTVGNYRFIHQDEIDQILEDELGDDAYIIGCFNAWFIADNTDLSIDIVEALQKSEQYESIGRHILDNDYLKDFAKAYSDADGYGNHFNHWDGGQIEDILSETGYYVFRIN